jgi:CRP-like cAMP-binding protein
MAEHIEALELLQQTPLFAGLSKADLEILEPSIRVETFPAGRVILREGRVGAAFFLLVSGSVEVVKEMGTPAQTVLTTMGAGDFFGEIAAMKHLLRTASVRALMETKCLVIQRLHLDSYLERFPNVLAKVESTLAARFDNRPKGADTTGE